MTAVFLREINARRDLLWLAAALAVLIFFLPLIPGMGGQSPFEVWQLTSVAVAIGLGWLMAIGLGVKTFGSDLSESRLGFFFNRPVGSVAMWHGRILGAYAMILLCEVIVLLPAFISMKAPMGEYIFAPLWSVVWLILVPAFLLLLAHAVGVMVRSRSPILVLDLLGVTAISGVVMAAVRPFLTVGADLAASVVGVAFAGAAVVALGVAGMFGLVVGRTDTRRTHAAMSIALWTCIAITGYGAFTYSHWLDDFGPDALGDVMPIAADPDWNWVAVAGSAPARFDIPRRFAVSTENGRWLRLPMDLKDDYWGKDKVAFSEDGNSIIWLGPGDREGALSVWWSDLRSATPAAVETLIPAPGTSYMTISDDRSKVAVLGDESYISVYDLASSDLLWMARTTRGLLNARVWFPDPDRLRISIRRSYDRDYVYWNAEYDANSGEVISVGEFDRWDSSKWPSVASVTDPHVPFSLHNPSDLTFRFQDPTTGNLIREVTVPEWADTIEQLADGRFVARTFSWLSPRLLAFENTATNEWQVYSPDFDWGYFRWTEVLPAKIAIQTTNPDASQHGDYSRLVLLDLETGEEKIIGDGALEQPNLMNNRSPMSYSSSFGQPSRRFDRFIFINSDGALVRWDPETGKTKTIAGGAK